MTTEICQVPGCKTTLHDMEKALNDYLVSYCEVCEKKRDGKPCSCPIPGSMTFKGNMLNKIQQILGQPLPAGIKSIQVCFKHTGLLKEARESSFLPMSEKKSLLRKQQPESSYVEEAFRSLDTADLGPAKDKMEKDKFEELTILNDLDERGFLADVEADSLLIDSRVEGVTSIIYTEESSQEQNMVGRVFYTTTETPTGSLIIQEMDTGQKSSEPNKQGQIVKIRFNDMDTFTMEEDPLENPRDLDPDDDDEELDRKFEQELQKELENSQREKDSKLDSHDIDNTVGGESSSLLHSQAGVASLRATASGAGLVQLSARDRPQLKPTSVRPQLISTAREPRPFRLDTSFLQGRRIETSLDPTSLGGDSSHRSTSPTGIVNQHPPSSPSHTGLNQFLGLSTSSSLSTAFFRSVAVSAINDTNLLDRAGLTSGAPLPSSPLSTLITSQASGPGPGPLSGIRLASSSAMTLTSASSGNSIQNQGHLQSYNLMMGNELDGKENEERMTGGVLQSTSSIGGENSLIFTNREQHIGKDRSDLLQQDDKSLSSSGGIFFSVRLQDSSLKKFVPSLLGKGSSFLEPSNIGLDTTTSSQLSPRIRLDRFAFEDEDGEGEVEDAGDRIFAHDSIHSDHISSLPEESQDQVDSTLDRQMEDRNREILKIQYKDYEERVLGAEMRGLCDLEKLCDVLFMCSDGRMPTSSIFLAAVSPFLRDLLDALPRIDSYRTIILPPDIPISSVQLLNKILFQEKYELTYEELESLLTIATTLSCHSIVQYCQSSIKSLGRSTISQSNNDFINSGLRLNSGTPDLNNKGFSSSHSQSNKTDRDVDSVQHQLAENLARLDADSLPTSHLSESLARLDAAAPHLASLDATAHQTASQLSETLARLDPTHHQNSNFSDSLARLDTTNLSESLARLDAAAHSTPSLSESLARLEAAHSTPSSLRESLARLDAAHSASGLNSGLIKLDPSPQSSLAHNIVTSLNLPSTIVTSKLKRKLPSFSDSPAPLEMRPKKFKRQEKKSLLKFDKTHLNDDVYDAANGIVRLSSVDEMAIHYCLLCSGKFKKYNQAITHYNKVHNITAKLSCDSCDQLFKDMFNCTKHKYQDHGQFDINSQCYICKEVFYSRFRLHSHIKDKHKSQYGEFVCKTCSMKFPAEYYLTIHRDTHKDVVNQCGICQKQFSGKRYLTMHIKSSHDLSRSKDKQMSPHKCEVCSKEFQTKRDRIYHGVKIHNLPKPVGMFEECSVCNKFFKCKNELRFHAQKHHKELFFSM